MHEQTIFTQVTALLYTRTKRERERESGRRTLTVTSYEQNVGQAEEFLFFLACEQTVNVRSIVKCVFIRLFLTGNLTLHKVSFL
jgi:hypothetical protein